MWFRQTQPVNNKLITVTLISVSLVLGMVTAGLAAVKPGETAPQKLDLDPAVNNIVYTNSIANVEKLYTIGILNLGQNDPVTVTIRIISIALTLLGMAFLVLLIYAGFLWALARGNEEAITKAKNLIKRAVIGFIIVMASLGISTTVFYQIRQATISNSTSHQ
ncbi:MAG: hypothetical protein HYV33_06155 [Candidatus Kerfeldbacteria bacterium]|nr:hypothetical protein [Candidatus Kerfeldbacteria bacterium]